MKQKVTMLKTLDGVDDGMIYPATYHEGGEYEIGDELLQCFVELGGVELAGLATRMPGEGTQTDGGNAEPESRETKVTGPEETKPAKPKKR